MPEREVLVEDDAEFSADVAGEFVDVAVPEDADAFVADAFVFDEEEDEGDSPLKMARKVSATLVASAFLRYTT
jgi:hypothetical protein